MGETHVLSRGGYSAIVLWEEGWGKGGMSGKASIVSPALPLYWR